jgi:hypothetical protein
MTAVFDAAAIHARRRELFPPMEPEPPAAGAVWGWGLKDRERFGTAREHCGICPKRADEHCGLNCETQRGALHDGVTVTWR